MTDHGSIRTSQIRPIPRRAHVVNAANLVNVEMPGASSAFAFPVIHAGDVAVDLFEWAAAERRLIAAHVLRFGAILLRGFRVEATDGVRRLLAATGGEPMPYVERSTPRREVADKIYTSTEYPADQRILPHNENSYAHIWPQRIAFHCITPAGQGGATTVVDCRRVFASIDPAVRRHFGERRVLYVRNFGGGLGLPWQEVFGTTSRSAVAEFCRAAEYEFEWLSADRLRTRRVAPAMVLHPRTGEAVWFNHAVLFNVTALPAEIRSALLAQRDEEALPNNTFFEDGAAIAPDVIEHIERAYDAHTASVHWQAGDLLLLDNMLMAHGRAPYSGPRRILVGMSDPIAATAVTAAPP